MFGWIVAGAIFIYDVYKKCKEVWDFVDENIKAFSELIHYEDLRRLHDIATIVSKEYREAWEGVYDQLSRFSRDIGIGSQTMALALRNARAVTLSASAIFGHPYDVAEVAWIAAFDKYLIRFNQASKHYENQPEYIWFDIDNYLIKKTYDESADFMGDLTDKVRKLVTWTDLKAKELNRFGEDLEHLTKAMPDKIKDIMLPVTDAITGTIDKFIHETYEPTLGDISSIVEELDKQQEIGRKALAKMRGQINNPGYLISDNSHLPYAEQLLSDQLAEDGTSRPAQKVGEELQELIKPEDYELQRLSDALGGDLTFPAWYVPEIDIPAALPQAEIDKSFTWYVGDF